MKARTTTVATTKKEKQKEKTRENSLNVSFSKDDTDTFEKGIEPQRCADVLHKCL